MGSAWALLLLMVTGLASLQVSQAKQHETHNPLEQINVLATTIQQDNQIRLVVSTTKLTKSRGEWVEVSICTESSTHAPAAYVQTQIQHCQFHRSLLFLRTLVFSRCSICCLRKHSHSRGGLPGCTSPCTPSLFSCKYC